MRKAFLLLAGTCIAGIYSFAQEKQDSLRLINLQEVQVVSTRAGVNIPVAYTNIGKEEIKKQNFGQDIPFLLTLSPSVVATSDAGAGIGYTNFRIRGTDATRINVTTNGIPLNDSESHGVFWVNMPDIASSLEDLQVQRGVGTSTNGAGAFGASINMKTENLSNKAYGELSGTYGAFNTTKAQVKMGTGLLNKHWAFDARISGINSDGFIDRASTDLKSYFAQAGYYGANTVLKFITFRGEEKTYHAWDGVPKDKLETDRTYNPSGYMGDDANGNPMYYENQTDNYKQTHYQFLLTHTFTPSLTLNAGLHYTRGKGYYEEYKTDRKLLEYGLIPFEYRNETVKKSDLVRQKWLDNHFGGGVVSLNYKKNRWDLTFGGAANRYDGDHFGKVIWVKNYIGNLSPDHTFYESNGTKTDANVYLKATYSITEGLTAYGDIQYRLIDYSIDGQNDTWDWINGEMQKLDVNKNFNFFNPKAGLHYQINQNQKVFASAAIAHREPARNNYTDASFNEKPKAERMIDYEAGYNFSTPLYSFGANLYYMKYKDQLVLTGKVNEIGEMLTSNIPDSYRAGIELMAAAQLTSWLRWDVNATFSKNKVKNYTEFVDLYDENWDLASQVENKLGTTTLAFSPSVVANSMLSASYKGWSAGLQSNYVGKQYIDNTSSNDRALDAYFVNNLRLGYTFSLKGLKSASVNLLVNNLFNEEYESNAWVYSYYQQPDASAGTRDRYADFGYFPQAGTHVLANLTLRF